MELSEEEKKMYESMGNNLGAIRNNNPNGKFYSQKDIAEIIKMNEPNYNSIECGYGKRHLKDFQIIKLSKFYNTSTDYLLGLTDETTPDIEEKEICKKYGLSEKALNNLSLLNSHKQIFKNTIRFNDVGTTIDTINFLLSEKMDNNNISILQLIDFYLNTEPSKKYTLALQEKGNVKLYEKTEKAPQFMSGKAFLSGDMLVEGILVEIINRLKKLKEGENNEYKRNSKK